MHTACALLLLVLHKCYRREKAWDWSDPCETPQTVLTAELDAPQYPVIMHLLWKRPHQADYQVHTRICDLICCRNWETVTQWGREVEAKAEIGPRSLAVPHDVLQEAFYFEEISFMRQCNARTQRLCVRGETSSPVRVKNLLITFSSCFLNHIKINETRLWNKNSGCSSWNKN